MSAADSPAPRRYTFARWWPVLLWMALIFCASTDLESSAHTGQIIIPLLRWLSAGRLSPETMDEIHFFIRKCAHLSEYGVLAALLWRALNPTYRLLRNAGLSGRVIWRVQSWCLLIAALYAASDEYHQSFVPSRTASVRDVCIDTCGAAIGLFLVWLAGRPFSRRAPTQAG